MTPGVLEWFGGFMDPTPHPPTPPPHLKKQTPIVFVIIFFAQFHHAICKSYNMDRNM